MSDKGLLSNVRFRDITLKSHDVGHLEFDSMDNSTVVDVTIDRIGDYAEEFVESWLHLIWDKLTSWVRYLCCMTV